MPVPDNRGQDSKTTTMTLPEQFDSGLSSIERDYAGPISHEGYLPSIDLNSLPEQPREAEAMDEVSDAIRDLSIHTSPTMPEDSGVYNSIREDEHVSNGSSSEGTARISTTDMKGRTLFLCQTMELLFWLFQGDEEGDNHLHHSIIRQQVKVALDLINNVPNYDWLSWGNLLRQTPLHLAVITCQSVIVRRLICAGARVTAQDKRGDTPLHIACRAGYADIVRHLLTPVTYEETLENAEEIPYQRVPQDLNIRNGDGETCLHVASRAGHTDIVKLLLGAGADVKVGDGKSGRTALHMAAESNDVEVAEVLIARNASVIDSKTYDGRTPLHLALGRNHTSIVSLIYRCMGTGEEITLSDLSDFEDEADEEDEDMLDD